MMVSGRQVIGGLVLLFLFVSESVLGQPSDVTSREEVARRQRELETIRREIESVEEKIQEARTSERESLTLLENLDRQSALVRTLLRQLRDREQRLVRDIDQTRRSIRTLEEQIEQLRRQYAGYVNSAYKRGTMNEVQLLLGSLSINQFIVRAEYLRRFTGQRRSDLREITEKQKLLQEEGERLESSLREQRLVIREKQQEEKRLSDRTTERQAVLKNIRQDKTAFETELARKQQAARQLQRMITDLIERERLLRQRDADRVREGRPSEIIPPSTSFASLRGSLPWPVRGGQIAARFGEQVHPVLKTVTENTGVDITIPNGSPVYSVAEGDVRIISWLPSYGNLVIVYHHDGYRSVYANLSEIFVTEGDRVTAGDMLARSGESISGSTIHFEIWKDREKENPEEWLQRR
jgi:murein hydrolase activator